MRKFLAATISLLGTSALTVLPAFALPDVSVRSLQGRNPQVSQVSSVSELTDVDPNQWAFQALKSLVERYGCIEGYPSKKYLGNRPLSRYEFAAGLNACLDKVGEQIAAATSNLATKDDLATMQRLQEEFKTELAALKGRTDALDAKAKELEAQQFSTTTKLDGSVVFAVQGGGAGGDVTLTGGNVVPGNSANTTFIGRTRLNLLTTFTGNDLLTIRMAGVTGSSLAGTFGANLSTAFAGTGTGALSNDQSTPNVRDNGTATVNFDKIQYSTTLFSDNFRVFIGPRLDLLEFIDTNSFANDEEVNFSSGFFVNNPIVAAIFAAPGLGFDWSINDTFSLRAAYLAQNGGQSFGSGFSGLTGSNSAQVVELEVKPSKSSAVRLQYAGNSVQATTDGLPFDGNNAGPATRLDSFNVNAEWAVTPSLGLFGRYGTATAVTPDQPNKTSNLWQFGVALPDLFAPGNTFGLAIGQPVRLTGPVADGGTETDIEAYYSFNINDRITLIPRLQFISQPYNISGNPTITVGTLQAVFKF
jgi:Carbohydrate-selective porin, OprB family/S-layer homology domain